MSRRAAVLIERAERPKDTGPQRTKRPLAPEDVDGARKFGCAKYEDCLTEMAIVGCRGWACPAECPWYRAAEAAELPYRTDEPTYDLGADSRGSQHKVLE
jgi:hypothetical protein